MRSSHSLKRLEVAFDGAGLVADAGLLLPATLAAQLGLRELVDEMIDLGDAPGRANAGDKVATLVASALAGGDCIDDADALRAGASAAVLGHPVKAPSTLGTFLRSFRWGHARQFDEVSRRLLQRAWKAGVGGVSQDRIGCRPTPIRPGQSSVATPIGVAHLLGTVTRSSDEQVRWIPS